MTTSAKRDGMYLFLLGCVTFLLLGMVLERASNSRAVDFAVVYVPAKTLLAHQAPYQPERVLATFEALHGDILWPDSKIRTIVSTFIYPPTAFAVILPFALLPWNFAYILWLASTAAALIVAGYLVWKVSSRDGPVLAGLLAGLVIANSESIFVLGNPAGIAIALGVISICLMLDGKANNFTALALALGIALKPHDLAFLWLFLFLAGGPSRRAALKSLLILSGIGVLCTAWVTVLDPRWLFEMSANLHSLSGHGGLTDPGPSSIASHGLGSMINLQSAFSFLWDQPGFYNWAAYIAGAVLLLLLARRFRNVQSPLQFRLGLAAFSAFSLLPVYHHLYDAKVLLLMIPACVALWSEAGRLRWPAVLVTSAALIVTGDFFWVALIVVVGKIPVVPGTLPFAIVTGMQMVPVPFVLLGACLFFLWAAGRGELVDRVDSPA